MVTKEGHECLLFLNWGDVEGSTQYIRELKEKIDKILKKYDMWTSVVSGNIMGAYRTVEMIPTAWYGKEAFYQFEDIKIRGIKEYDKYLHHLYGDYMQLPSVNARKIHFRIVEIHGQKIEES